MDNSKPKKNYFIKHWRGELSLPVSYWVNGFLTSIVTYTTIIGLGLVIGKSSSNYAYLIFWATAITATTLLVIWQTVGTWRSADKHTEKGGNNIWSTLAKLMVIIGIISLVTEYSKTYIPALKESYKQAVWLSDTTWKTTVSDDGKEIEISGGISNGISKDFQSILNTSPNIKYVHVNLHKGGLIKEALKLQQIIRENRLSTYVSSECVSACTLVFLGGEKKYLRKFARIGFHAYSVPGVHTDDMSFSDYKKDLLNLGLTRRFVDRIFETPKEEMWFPDTDELLTANVIHQVVNGDEFLLLGTDNNFLTKNLKEIDRSLKEIEAAETIEDSVTLLNKYNNKMKNMSGLLAAKAKSPASLKFMEYHYKQEELAEKGVEMMLKVAEIAKVIENINSDTTDEDELNLLTVQFVKLCRIDREYILLISDIVNAIDMKISLYKDPIVFEEIFNKEPRTHQLLLTFRDNQNKVLKEEKEVYQQLDCDTILASN